MKFCAALALVVLSYLAVGGQELAVFDFQAGDCRRKLQLFAIFRRVHHFLHGGLQRRLRNWQRTELTADGLEPKIAVGSGDAPFELEGHVFAVEIEDHVGAHANRRVLEGRNWRQLHRLQERSSAPGLQERQQEKCPDGKQGKSSPLSDRGVASRIRRWPLLARRPRPFARRGLRLAGWWRCAEEAGRETPSKE